MPKALPQSSTVTVLIDDKLRMLAMAAMHGNHKVRAQLACAHLS